VVRKNEGVTYAPDRRQEWERLRAEYRIAQADFEAADDALVAYYQSDSHGSPPAPSNATQPAMRPLVKARRRLDDFTRMHPRDEDD
jgi:hypothetical protein